jgi:hypothetical protein
MGVGLRPNVIGNVAVLAGNDILRSVQLRLRGVKKATVRR